MPLELDDLRIEDRQLTSLIFDADNDIFFNGRALDKEGKDICDRLAKFKIDSLVEVTAESHYIRREGVYRIYEIKIPSREEKDRVIYRFSGKLTPVY